MAIDISHATARIGVLRQHFIPTAEYSAAIVFSLCDVLTRRVHALRADLQASLVAGAQPVPHLTVVYIGRRLGAQLQLIWSAVQQWTVPAIALRTEGLGRFTSGGSISNIHLKVAATDEVTSVHFEALRMLEALNETSDTAYKALAYVPHISIFDGICAVESALPVVSDDLILCGHACGLHMMARLELP